jgi:uncharacterized membrane protein YkvA (DUF1232 family)
MAEREGGTELDIAAARHPALRLRGVDAKDFDESRFRDKVRRTLGRLPFIETALAAHHAALDRKTPASAKAVLLAALAYFVMPADMIPDFLVGLGFTDDMAVLLTAVRALSPHITAQHHAEARRQLGKEATPG